MLGGEREGNEVEGEERNDEWKVVSTALAVASLALAVLPSSILTSGSHSDRPVTVRTDAIRHLSNVLGVTPEDKWRRRAKVKNIATSTHKYSTNNIGNEASRDRRAQRSIKNPGLNFDSSPILS